MGYPNVARWYKHIKSYEAEFSTLSGSSSAGTVFTGEAAPPKKEEKTEEGAGDDDFDLFGEDEEDDAEAERVKNERIAAYNAKKASKPKTVAKVRDSVTPLTLRCIDVVIRSLS